MSQSAYDALLSNLNKSTAAVPVHLQPATEALSWWAGPDSLMQKAALSDPEAASTIQGSPVEPVAAAFTVTRVGTLNILEKAEAAAPLVKAAPPVEAPAPAGATGTPVTALSKGFGGKSDLNKALADLGEVTARLHPPKEESALSLLERVADPVKAPRLVKSATRSTPFSGVVAQLAKAEVRHDAFARQSLHRTEVSDYAGKGCDNCGQTNSHGKLYQYHVVNDASLAGRKQPIKGKFCGADCMRSYHG